jgi:hypothetical protein
MSRAFDGKSETDWLKANPQGDFARLGKVINITEDVRKYAAEQGLSEEEAVESRMQEKAKEFIAHGTEVYGNA